ncbi:unnamed protein product, partial [Prorocentrum cordatum]
TGSLPMRPAGVGLHLFCHIGALGLARWWWTSPAVPTPPVVVSERPAHSLAGASRSELGTVVPLADCLAAALEGHGAALVCPCACTPGLACKAGEASWSFPLGVGAVAFPLLEALKATVRLATSAARSLLPGRRPLATLGEAPTVDAETSAELERFAAEQARASTARSHSSMLGNVAA